MSNQSFIFNLKIKINENNEGEILYNNSSSKLKNVIFCYMNDKINCHTSLYNSYYNADIEVRKEEVTPITGVSATAFIKVRNEVIKSSTNIYTNNTDVVIKCDMISIKPSTLPVIFDVSSVILLIISPDSNSDSLTSSFGELEHSFFLKSSI